MPVSLRNYLAANAPTEIPEWFRPNLPAIPLYKGPAGFLTDDPRYKALTREQQRILFDWMHDSGYDIDESLMALGREAYDKHAQLERDRERISDEREEARYFKWRWYYAENMVGAGDVSDDTGANWLTQQVFVASIQGMVADPKWGAQVAELGDHGLESLVQTAKTIAMLATMVWAPEDDSEAAA